MEYQERMEKKRRREKTVRKLVEAMSFYYLSISITYQIHIIFSWGWSIKSISGTCEIKSSEKKNAKNFRLVFSASKCFAQKRGNGNNNKRNSIIGIILNADDMILEYN